MDVVLEICDDLFLDYTYAKAFPKTPLPTCAYAPIDAPSCTNGTASDILHYDQLSSLGRDSLIRQTISLSVLTYIGIHFLYFICAGLSYQFIYDKRVMRHPRFLKNQLRMEIDSSLSAFGPLTLMTVPWFIADVRDFCIYWVHRIEHHPMFYKWLHKPHHKWLIPTPFASHAFHPLDGYLQSVPYHLFIFIFPLHKYLYLGLFGFVNIWSILIHDGDMRCGGTMEKIINGPSHHTLHHLYFTVNYGQYFTFSDRAFNSHREPKPELDPLNQVLELEEKERNEKKENKKSI
ncbi:lathosterol oxidase [Wallemia mellicola]|uniref:Lathosterol oxidase n=1 Tax=Wallemia mellicola TaxID=1708541 RepID=A0A4T0N8E6_9BASI|nr:lathosterol oxidase [Wallemia mellicola]TIB99357.1 lathosterol oxidase [Wallemia mellicola]TIC02939.1 lathosterol oxidase [Wallemia mellicola]TIC27921.1 lathosterol oxidase [Wallemia mellicola]TIC44749.1 lathosterol oxidase [Wallemia mellicola]